MPRGDGTGPFGLGPGTGRGRGWCRGFSSGWSGFGPRRMGFIGSLVPVAAAVIRDLMNSNGLLRSFSRKMLTKKEPEHEKAIDATYVVIDEDGTTGKNRQAGADSANEKARITR